MTETAPFALSAHLPDWQAGIIGTPPPGLEVKLVQQGDKLEVRYRGPSITPGYWRQPELTAEAFDEEGFLCSGDAASFIDDNAPEQGLRYDGRIAEDFKLASGTWVNVGALVLRDPPSMDLGEMTDKGSINQRSVLKTRAALVEQLYAAKPGSDTLLAKRSKAPAI